MFHIWPQWGPTPDQAATFPMENQGPMSWTNFDPGAVRPHWGWNAPGWTPGANAPPFQPLPNQAMPPPRPPLGPMDPEPKPGEAQPIPNQTMFPPPGPNPNQVPGPMGPWMGPWPSPQGQWPQAPGHWPMAPNQTPWGPQPGPGGWPVPGPWGFTDPMQQQHQQWPQQQQQPPPQQNYLMPGDPTVAGMVPSDQQAMHHQSQQQMPQASAPQTASDSSNANGQAFALIDEADFEQKFTDWEKQFEAWKEQNKNHPDKEAFAKYEKQWQTLREQLLQRREALRAQKAAQMMASAPPPAPTPAPAAPVQQPKDMHVAQMPSAQASTMVPQALPQSNMTSPAQPMAGHPPPATMSHLPPATPTSAPQLSISSAPPPPPPSSMSNAPPSTNASHASSGPLLPTPTTPQTTVAPPQTSCTSSSTSQVNSFPPTSAYASSTAPTNSSTTPSTTATSINPPQNSNTLPISSEIPSASRELQEDTSEKKKQGPDGIPFLESIENRPGAEANQMHYLQTSAENKNYPPSSSEQVNTVPPGRDTIPNAPPSQSYPESSSSIQGSHLPQENAMTQQSNSHQSFQQPNTSQQVPNTQHDSFAHLPPTSNNYYGGYDNAKPSEYSGQGEWSKSNQSNPPNQYPPSQDHYEYADMNQNQVEGDFHFPSVKPGGPTPEEIKEIRNKQEKLKALEDDAPADDENQLFLSEKQGHYFDENQSMSSEFHRPRGRGGTIRGRGNYRQRNWQSREEDEMEDRGPSSFQQDIYHGPPNNDFNGRSYQEHGATRPPYEQDDKSIRPSSGSSYLSTSHSFSEAEGAGPPFHSKGVGPQNADLPYSRNFPEQGGRRFPPFSERPPFPQEQPGSFSEQGPKMYPDQTPYQESSYPHSDQRDGSFHADKPYQDPVPYPDQRPPPPLLDDPYFRNRPPPQFSSKPDWQHQGFPPSSGDDFNEQYGPPRQLHEERFPPNTGLPPPIHHRLPSTDAPSSFQPRVFEYGHRPASIVHGESFAYKHDQVDTHRNVFSYNYFKPFFPNFDAFSRTSADIIDYQHGVANVKPEVAKGASSDITFPAARSMKETKGYGSERRSIFSEFSPYRSSSPSHRNSPRHDFMDLEDKKEDSIKDKEDKSELFPSAAEIKVDPVAIKDLLVAPGRSKRPKQMVFILRGPPGSGKTSLAKLIKDKEVENGGGALRILSLDDYFMVESEVSEIDPETGKRVKNKDYEYEYEPEMEETYRASLYKSFKKTIDDRLFPIIVVDAVNDKIKHFENFCSYAKSRGFQVYILEMDTTDPLTCFKHNIHKRSLDDIKKIIVNWEETPLTLMRADVRSLIQDASIQDVEMEESNADDSKSKEQDEEDEEDEDDDQEDTLPHLMLSRWEKFEKTEAKLDKLDGLIVGKRKHSTLEDYLQLPDDYEQRTVEPGKKRVRWADIEEKKEQDRLRAIGFVVGQTDWDKMMDHSQADKALTRTKYF